MLICNDGDKQDMLSNGDKLRHAKDRQSQNFHYDGVINISTSNSQLEIGLPANHKTGALLSSKVRRTRPLLALVAGTYCRDTISSLLS